MCHINITNEYIYISKVYEIKLDRKEIKSSFWKLQGRVG